METSAVVQVRRTTFASFVAVVITGTLAVTLSNLLLFSREDSFVWALHRATGGWINANLTTFVPLTLVIIGGMVMAWGRQSLADLGLSAGWALRLVLLLLAGWAAMQLVAVAAALASGMEIALHPAWTEYGAGTVLGLFIAMVLGTAPFEDGLFRGYVLPQLYFLLGRRISGETARMLAALMLCAVIFALWHLPTILLNRGEIAPGAVAGALAYMLLGGVMLGLLYLRTGRLEIVIALHALVNAPTMLVASPLPGSALAGAIGVAAIIAGPVLAGERRSAGLVRFVPR
ncbi:MAG: CPBP family intramembrane glutamic endopeptidase [Erythrobacter sp.]|jgi:membrane protease YdiL (CAAX protease family)|nr:CPBP family intramembrane glutamic endopeptidase [Erythrobacter sp.]